MRRVLAAVAAAVLAVASYADDQAPARAAPAPRAIDAEFLAAFRARDESAMERLVGDMNRFHHMDPFIVADCLFLGHARGVLADPAARDDLLDAAREVARRSIDRPRNASLPGLVDAWSRADEAEMRRRVALHEACGLAWEGARAHDAAARGADPAPLVALAGEAADVTAVRALWEAAQLATQYRTQKDALAAWRTVAERARRAAWPAREAASTWQAGMTAYRAGESGTARALWLEQVAFLESLGERAEAASSLLFVADAEERLGHYAEAAALSERAFALAETERDLYVAALARTQAASALVLSGDCARALAVLDDARQRFDRDLDSVIGSAWTHAVTGRAYAALGLWAEAIDSFEKAIAQNDTRPAYRATSARYRSELAQVLADAGQPERAADLQRRTLEDVEKAGDPVETAAARVRLGRALAACGRTVDAATTLQDAVAELDARGVRGSAAAARSELARVRAASGRIADARDLARTALAEMEAVGDRIGAARVLCDLAAWERELSRPAEALVLASRAMETPLALGMGLGDEESAGLRRVARTAADAGLLAVADLLSAESADRDALCADAFRLVESSRGLALAENILNRDALFDAASAAASRSADAAARDRVAAMRNRLADLAAKPGAQAAELTSARADLDAAHRALAESSARVQREARRIAELVYPRPAELDDVRRSLGNDTVLAMFHLTAERAFALAVTRDSARLVDLGRAPELDDAARAYADVVAVPGSDEVRKAAALYERLLRPLERETSARKRIVLSPDGALSFVPFDALVRTDGAATQRVIERWEVECVPSATVRHLLAREPAAAGARTEDVVALGDPDYGDASAPRGAALRAYGRLRRLPGTADEVRAVEAVALPGRCTTLLGEKATARGLADAIAARGGRLAALHLACHGHFDTARPRLTGLVLSHGEVLTADDVLRMRIPADVVVLSACSTGRGPVVRGEGVMGLARAFLFAGASRVVVSNWAVSDDAASQLMSAFARRLLRDRLPAREALRGAKLDLLRSGGPLAHPASWGAFAIWGD